MAAHSIGVQALGQVGTESPPIDLRPLEQVRRSGDEQQGDSSRALNACGS